jgi:tetratricopeptide (TPR) repeat protein
LGVTQATASLRGRLAIRDQAYDEAIRQMDLARLLDDDPAGANPKRLVELGLARGVRGRRENRTFDVMQGLDNLLRAQESGRFGAAEYEDLALLASDIPAPHAAVGFWTEAVKRADAGSRPRLEKARAAEQEVIDRRTRLVEEVERTHRARKDIPGSTELLLQTALAEWIGDREHHEEDLRALAAAFQEIHGDPMVRDLISMPSSREAERALMAAAAANKIGDHRGAVPMASMAKAAFARLGNPAAEILASNELLDAMWRTGQQQCAAPWLLAAEKHGYRQAVLRGRFEQIACRAGARDSDLLDQTERLVRDAAGSGYVVLATRSLAGATEPYRGDTSPSRAWERGHNGLGTYWTTAVSLNLASNLYNPLAASAKSLGKFQVAVILYEEVIAAIRKSPNTDLIATAERLLEGARILANRQDVRVRDELGRAQLANQGDRPGEALEVAAQLTGGTSQFPYEQLPHFQRIRAFPILGRALWMVGRRQEAIRHLEFCVELTTSQALAAKSAQRESMAREGLPCLRELIGRELQMGETGLALRKWQKFRSISTDASGTLPTPRAGEAWVSMARLSAGWVVWLLDSQGLAVNMIHNESPPVLAERFASLAATQDVPEETVRKAGERLSAGIFGPLRSRIEGARLAVFDPEGILALVPWAALPRLSGGFLADGTATVQAIGWARATRPVPELGTRAVAVSDPAIPAQIRAQFPLLSDADGEAEAVRRAFPATLQLAGKDATRIHVEVAIQSASLFHFFGHGIALGGSSGLLLSGTDGNADVLSAADVAGLDLRGLGLAVLTACSSGGVQTPGALNLESLSQSFLAAGAGRVIAARWNVDSAKTAAIMKVFYRHLSAGTESAEALRRAMWEVRKTQTHPWYWAAMQLFGAR